MKDSHVGALLLLLGIVLLCFWQFPAGTQEPQGDIKASSAPAPAHAPDTSLPSLPQHQQTAARLCDPDKLPNETTLNANKKSQFGEDTYALALFHGLCGGTYIELGANDGKTGSNTWLFNKALGWKGVLIELGPGNFKKLVINRPPETEIAVVHSGVCETKQKLHYVERGGTGGIWEFMAPSFRKHWWGDRNMENMQTIDCRPLQHILDEVKASPFIDFFSLDVEGAELKVLRSLDWSKFSFGLGIVECDSNRVLKDLAVVGFLEERGYVYMGKLGKNDINCVFYNKRLGEIYNHVLYPSGVKH